MEDRDAVPRGVRGVTYEYRVCAFNSVGSSEWTDAESVTMPGGRCAAGKSLAFGTIRAGATRTRSFVVRNRDRVQALALRAADLTGPFDVDDVATSEPWIVVPPRGKVKLRVTYVPLLPGTGSGLLTLATSDETRPTVTVKLSGRARKGRT